MCRLDRGHMWKLEWRCRLRLQSKELLRGPAGRAGRAPIVGRTLLTARFVVRVVEALVGTVVQWLEQDKGAVFKLMTGGTVRMGW